MKRNDLVARSLTLGLAVATAAVTQTSEDKKAGISAATVAKITYKTSRKSVATVNKNGTITTKKAGTVTIRATVTLKNGETKSVKMTLTVKKAK